METDLDLNSHKLLNYTPPSSYHYSFLYGTEEGGTTEKPLANGRFVFNEMPNHKNVVVLVPQGSVISNVRVMLDASRAVPLMLLLHGDTSDSSKSIISSTSEGLYNIANFDNINPTVGDSITFYTDYRVPGGVPLNFHFLVMLKLKIT